MMIANDAAHAKRWNSYLKRIAGTRPTVCRSASNCKPIAWLASGPTEVKQSGTSLNPVMWTALQTASAIGDDRLQRRSQGYVVPDAFTHGTSAQRSQWFTTGLKSGTVASCDTFRNEQL
jgi:Putative neutral zinc metallopeptidase